MAIDTNASNEQMAKPSVAQAELDERDRLIHDLEVHQAELEAQNQQLREAHHQIEESRARYSDLYDFAPVAYCTFDRAGCVTEINLTGAAMLGTQRSRVIGKPFALYLREADRAVFRSHLQRRLQSPQGPEVVELTLAGPQPIVVQMVSVVARNHGGAIVSCRSTFTDITEQKRAEEALRLAVHMREEFLAVVSHDLRNPLNSVLLASELLQSTAASDTVSLGKINIIHNAAKRMGRMLSDLLDLSSMDAGHLSMTRKPESVDALLAAIIEAASSGAAAKQIQLEVAVDEPQLIAYCDHDRILQVLLNLVGNAIKFSSRNGRVRIEARRTGDEIEFAVRDWGAGMAKSQVDHIFDPYWQAPKTAKLGTGLGLSIARGIVEFHGGRIWAESVVDRGSSFFFTVPATPEIEWTQEAATRERRKSGPLSGSNPIVKPPVEVPPSECGPILIVDDEPDVQVLLSDLLRSEGYEVATASDGAEALAYLQTATPLPCLILLDLVMPNVDGWEFVEQRSHDRRLARIPVVLISGQVAARETARSLGLASYIEKPIEVAAIREMLSRIRGSIPALA
jgi:chemotaxis family two-component system sensor kinase Cph1